MISWPFSLQISSKIVNFVFSAKMLNFAISFVLCPNEFLVSLWMICSKSICCGHRLFITRVVRDNRLARHVNLTQCKPYCLLLIYEAYSQSNEAVNMFMCVQENWKKSFSLQVSGSLSWHKKQGSDKPRKIAWKVCLTIILSCTQTT